MKKGVDLARSKSRASRKSISYQSSHSPPRKSSSRSGHVENTGGIQPASWKTEGPSNGTEPFPPFFMTSSGGQTSSVLQPLSAQPSIAFSEQARHGSHDETHRTGASSCISSQQIRKARSMYYASSVQTGSPIARPPAKYLITPPKISPTSAPEQVPAFSTSRFFSTASPASSRVPVILTANETIDQARDRYLQSFQQKSVKHKPSMFLASFKKRQNKGKEKDDHTSSNATIAPLEKQHTPDPLTAGIALSSFVSHSGLKERRSFSGSIRSRIRRVFRRTSGRSPILPVQQIEANNEYFGGSHDTHPVPTHHSAVPTPDENIVRRTRARAASLESPRSILRKSKSRTSSNASSRSNRSLHSEVNALSVDSSRGTSWGTSSTGETLTQRALKRLTVIHEAKDSIGSDNDRLTFIDPSKPSPPALAAFRDPMPLGHLIEDNLSPVDPKRVFSALMKEIDATDHMQVTSSGANRTPDAEPDIFSSGSTNEVHFSVLEGIEQNTDREIKLPLQRSGSVSAQSARSKASTVNSIGKAIRMTIRTVTPAEQHSTDVKNPSQVTNTFSNLETTLDSLPHSSHDHRKQTLQVFCPSAAQIETRKEKSDGRWKAHLEDIEKPQFPRETYRTYDVKNFAEDRSSLKISSTSITRTKDCSGLFGNTNASSGITSPCRLKSRFASPPEPPISMCLSPSVYSRDTDGISIGRNGSFISLGNPDGVACTINSGSAIIQTSQSVRSYVLGTPSPQRLDSTRNSRDWKAWLSREVSGIESISQEDITICKHYATSTSSDKVIESRTLDIDHDNATVMLRNSGGTLNPTQTENTPPIAVHSTDCEQGYGTRLEKGQSAFLASNAEPVLIQKIHLTSMELDTAADPKIAARTQTGAEGTPKLQHIPSTPCRQWYVKATEHDVSNLARMNERFPYINRPRRSSNYSADSSHHSKSPTDSIVSIHSAQSTKVTSSSQVHSRIPVTKSKETPSPRASHTALKRSDARCKRKENVTPSSVRGHGKPEASSPAMVCPGTPASQPLTTITIHQKHVNSTSHNAKKDNYSTSVLGSVEFRGGEGEGGVSETIIRPRIRASLRPLSPEKLARRPRSAFDLRSRGDGLLNTLTSSPTVSRSQTTLLKTDIPPPARCSPLVQYPVSSELHSPSASCDPFVQAKEPSPTSSPQRVIESVIEDADAEWEYAEDKGEGMTPGQRLADRFLKGRKSAGVLDVGATGAVTGAAVAAVTLKRGGWRLTREDTPAFL